MKNITVKIFAGLLLVIISTTSMFGVFGLRKQNGHKTSVCNWVTSGSRRLSKRAINTGTSLAHTGASALNSCCDFGTQKAQALKNFGKSVARLPGILSSAADHYLNDPSSDEFPLSRVEIAKVAATNCVQHAYNCVVHDVHTAARVAGDLIGKPFAIAVGRPLGVLVHEVTQPTIRSATEQVAQKIEPLIRRVEALPQAAQTTARGVLQDGRLTLFGPQSPPIVFPQSEPTDGGQEEQKERAKDDPIQPVIGIIPRLEQTSRRLLQQGAETAKAASRQLMTDGRITLLGHQPDPIPFDSQQEESQSGHHNALVEDSGPAAAAATPAQPPVGVLHQFLTATRCMLRETITDVNSTVVGGAEVKKEDSLLYRASLVAKEQLMPAMNQHLTKIVGLTFAGIIATITVRHALKTRQPILLQTKTGSIKTLLPIRMH